MFADVYPILRLPRRFGVFTYAIPDTLSVEPGMIVRIPFRNRTVYGLVADCHDRAPERGRVQAIASIAAGWTFSQTERAYFDAVALESVQSVSSLLHAIIPSFPKRHAKAVHSTPTQPLTIDKRDATALTAAVAHVRTHSCSGLTCPDLRQLAAVVSGLQRTDPLPTLVCAPTVHDAELLLERLAQWNPVLLTGDESPLARERAWRQWRGSDSGLMIGTSLAILFPHPSGGRVIMARASHERHRREDRNPRFDARRCVQLLQQTQHVRVCWTDAFLRIDEREQTATLAPWTPPETWFSDMRANLGHRPHPLLSPEACEQAEQALARGERVLFAYNMLEAENHTHSTQTLARTLPYVFDREAAVCVKGQALPDTPMVVATSHYTENLFDPRVSHGWGAVIYVDGSAPLRDADPRATERALTQAATWQAVARAHKARCVIQSDHPDLFREGLSQPDVVLAQERSARMDYLLPPFGRVLRIYQAPDLTELLAPFGDQVRLVPSGEDVDLYYPESVRSALHSALRVLPDEIRIDTTSFL